MNANLSVCPRCRRCERLEDELDELRRRLQAEADRALTAVLREREAARHRRRVWAEDSAPHTWPEAAARRVRRLLDRLEGADPAEAAELKAELSACQALARRVREMEDEVARVRSAALDAAAAGIERLWPGSELPALLRAGDMAKVAEG